MDRWKVYSFLKRHNGNMTVEQLMAEFEDVKENEIAEGFAEYCLVHRKLQQSKGA